MTPKGADLEATDLIEVSTIESGSYVTRSITGQELIDAIPLPPTGLTIGTTPIASGTIGRVLFQGTGNVLQQSSSLFWDNTNGRLGIGTSSPSQALEIRNGFNLYSSGVSANAYYLEATSSTSTDGTLSLVRAIGGTGTTRLTFQGLELSTNTNSGENRLVGSSGQFWTFTTNGSEKMRLLTNGNLLINTTTDAGFRLDVNGTARVQGSATILNNGGRLTLQQTVGGSIFNGINFNDFSGFTNASIINNQNTGEFRLFTAASYFPTFYSNGSERMRIPTTGNVLINTTTDAGFRLDVNGTVRSTSTITGNNLTSVANVLVGAILYGTNFSIATNGQTSFGAGGFNAPASALVAVTSTTQGFLPPRMTTTQRNAIASPAAGLMVYDTTLNAMFYFNGTIWI
jgi:hypothetical protein